MCPPLLKFYFHKEDRKAAVLDTVSSQINLAKYVVLSIDFFFEL
jgi:hypothetical protein